MEMISNQYDLLPLYNVMRKVFNETTTTAQMIDLTIYYRVIDYLLVYESSIKCVFV